MITINTMEGGMNKDISAFNIQPKTYIDAQNFRLSLNIGKNMGSIETIKGTKKNFQFPDIRKLYKLTIIGSLSNNLSINGVSANTTGAGITTGKQLAAFILDPINGYNVTDEIKYTFIDGTQQVTTIPAAVFYGATFVYITGIDAALTINVSSGLVQTTVISDISNTIPIGYTPLRDSMYILTTGVYSYNSTNPGQIWKAEFDDTLDTVYLYLKYNNILGLSIEHLVMEEAVGFYSREEFQAVYWTDNKNKLRRFNDTNDAVLNTQPFCINPNLLNVFPDTVLSIPILKSIQLGGSLTAGTKQYSYRTMNVAGTAKSNFSELSNIINIINKDENSAPYNSYFPGSSVTNKSVTLQIDGIDINYDLIQIVCIEKTSDNGTPVVRIIKEQPVPKSGILKFTHYGSENTVEITTNELIHYNNTFDTCKTLAVKNNHLFIGNTNKNKFDPQFDTRAYSFNLLHTASISDVNGNVIRIIDNSLSNAPTLAEQESTMADSINSDQFNPLYAPQLGSAFAQRFNSIGHPGGTGVNISYEWGTQELHGDEQSDLGMLDTSLNPLTGAGYVTCIPITSDYSVGNRTFTNINQPQNYKSPYLAGLLRSYFLGEVYRFGIVFYDKQGIPGYVNWIADIRTPVITDTNYQPGPSAILQGVNDFRTSWVESSNNKRCILQVPKLIFTLRNFDTIADQISGYSIVRCERTDSDKTKVAQGLLAEVVGPAGPNNDKYFANSTAGTGIPNTQTKWVFQSPDHLFDKASIRSGDTIHALVKTNYVGGPASTTPNFYSFKRYGGTIFQMNVARQTIKTAYTVVVPTTDNISIAQENYYNYSDPVNPPAVSNHAKTLYLETTNPLAFISFNGIIAEIERDSTGRYGGSDYVSRSGNIYISCGHYSTDITNSIIYNENVFGGDMFASCFVNQFSIKNWRTDHTINQYSEVDIFPVCSTVNCELREGTQPNYTAFLNTSAGLLDTGEDYTYNGVFSNSMDIKKYFAKPFNLPDISTYDTRVYASDLKIAGETSDSWANFPVYNFMDLENQYGSITDIVEHSDKLFIVQERGLVNISVNPRSLITDTSGAQLILGSGTLLSRYDYIDQYAGSIHQNSVIKTPEGIYFFDIKTCKIMFYNKELSDIKGMHSWLIENLQNSTLINADNEYTSVGPYFTPRGGICSTYDAKNKECWWTFNYKDNTTLESHSYTLVYNEIFQAFTGFFSHHPYMYLNLRNKIYSPYGIQQDLFINSDSKKIYRHDHGDENKFYGTTVPSSISILVNDNPLITKIFQSIRYHSDAINAANINLKDITFDTIEAYNDYQNTSPIPLVVSTNIGRYEREWRTEIPLNAIKTNLSDVDLFDPVNYDITRLYREFLTDKYITLKLSYTPEDLPAVVNSNKLRFNYLATEYIASKR